MTFPVLLFQIQGYLPSPRRVYNSVKNITRRTNYYEIVACFGNYMYLCSRNQQDMEKDFITFEEYLDEEYGKVGTQVRDEFERNVDESVHAYKLGEAIKQARLSQNLTQEQLGEKVGVQKSQISRLERGRSISLASMVRIFKAMGIPLTLEMGSIGRVSLC